MTATDTHCLPNDAELVERAVRGELSAYETLVQRYERLVRAAASSVTCDRHAAEDAAQESFLTAFRTLTTLREPAKFAPWLLAITRHEAARFVRSQVRSPVLVPDIEVSSSVASNELMDRRERLLECFERLPDHERVVVGLRYFDGHTIAEISHISSRPVGTITKQLSRALARLEQWMNKESRT
jgi:RNA polymerase sigma-70 factor (ECF subfamily)